MAWTVHFGNAEITNISDAAYTEVQQKLEDCGQGIVWLRLEQGTKRFDLLWSKGCPIYFSYFAEQKNYIGATVELRLTGSRGK